MKNKVIVIGGGLAGSEAAWQLAQRNINVELFEMRPIIMTEAHHSENLGELVCSNSLRASSLDNAAGLLKEELRVHGSLIMEAADKFRIPSGGAHAVDRISFQRYITEKIENHPKIKLIREEIIELPDEEICIIASGPLTSKKMSEYLTILTGIKNLYFYDAAAPIINANSINMEYAFWQSRYDKGDPNDYLNCPLSKEEYEEFYQALKDAEWTETKDFEEAKFFEGCMPIETMAQRGFETLRFGPFKPVGLKEPTNGKQPYAVLQLRFDDANKQLMNLVGCQTRMKWGEQKRVFSIIPALRNAEFFRFGIMHRNTFINSPILLDKTNQFKLKQNYFFAGQITGVEGYIESTASGCIAGINAARFIRNKELIVWPRTTAFGALLHYITTANPHNFQPMNINFGIFQALNKRIKDRKQRNFEYSRQALEDLGEFIEKNRVSFEI